LFGVLIVHPASSISMSDTFSPIMIAGAFVLPDVMVGMIDASATLSLPTP
jgi:hypothetical protein